LKAGEQSECAERKKWQGKLSVEGRSVQNTKNMRWRQERLLNHSPVQDPTYNRGEKPGERFEASKSVFEV
jgi:hypothetical protein